MRPLSAAALLDVWERGQPLPPARQALLLLAAACPDEPSGSLTRLPVGRRDERLMTLRSWTFGDRLTGAVSCPSCGEQLEIESTLAALRARPAEDIGAGAAARGPEVLELEHEGYHVQFRLPTVEDLVALLDDQDAGASDLLTRCVLAAEREGEPVEPNALPGSVVARVEADMESADPQAHVLLGVECSACGHLWQIPFDVASFFWSEIDRWARRTLEDVHTLASEYGWAEAEILAMSAWRRQGYLNLIRR